MFNIWNYRGFRYHRCPEEVFDFRFENVKYEDRKRELNIVLRSSNKNLVQYPTKKTKNKKSIFTKNVHTLLNICAEYMLVDTIEWKPRFSKNEILELGDILRELGISERLHSNLNSIKLQSFHRHCFVCT